MKLELFKPFTQKIKKSKVTRAYIAVKDIFTSGSSELERLKKTGKVQVIDWISDTLLTAGVSIKTNSKIQNN